MSTALFDAQPRTPIHQDTQRINASRKSNHMLAMIFGDTLIQKESFTLGKSSDTDAALMTKRKYGGNDLAVLDKNSLEPKLVHAPTDHLAPVRRVEQVALHDLEEIQKRQQAIMATLIVAGSALLAWFLSSRMVKKK